MVFRLFTGLYDYHHCLIPGRCPCPKRKPSLAVTPHSLTPPAPGTHCLHVSIDPPTLDISYKWNHIIVWPLVSVCTFSGSFMLGGVSASSLSAAADYPCVSGEFGVKSAGKRGASVCRRGPPLPLGHGACKVCVPCLGSSSL